MIVDGWEKQRPTINSDSLELVGDMMTLLDSVDVSLKNMLLL